MNRPPRDPHQRQKSSASQSSASASASQKTTPSASLQSSSNNSSNSPSESATIVHGHALLNNCLRSLLSHELALPLFHALHGKDPEQQTYLAKKSLAFAKEENGHAYGDTIFKEAVQGWVKEWRQQITEPKKPRTERQLTESLNKLIHGAFQDTYFQSLCEVEVKRTEINSSLESISGRIDILLSSCPNGEENPSTPLAVIEVGRKNNEWMKKLDQAGNYLDIMKDNGMKKELKFQNAILFAILTLEGEENTQKSKFQSQFGVFLCWPNSVKGFRMTLLWSARSSDLTTASEDFGRFLRVVASFAVWRNDAGANGHYHYLSSNVGCVDKTILRSYDTRVRETERSSDIYLDEKCKEIVGGTVQTVVKHPDKSSTETVRGFDAFWVSPSSGKLLIIAISYKSGMHYATRPVDFIPVIDELKTLHDCGYVHGDIRGFNVLFGEKGGLIDFDFGGIPGKAYPKGYRRKLDDGTRLGTGDARRPHNTLQYYHDWYALGKLMFYFHRWKAPPNSASYADRQRYSETSTNWEDLESDPTDADIDKLKRDLDCFDQHWTVYPERTFHDELRLFLSKNSIDTFGGATGSPNPIE